MPSTSAKQHRFMQAVKHNPKFARKVGVPQAVGEDFVAADKRTRKFAAGGALGMASQQIAPKTGVAGPHLLQGQRPGVPNPRMPLVHPMSPMMGGLRGMLQMADHSLVNTGPKLRDMNMRLAKGGKVASIEALVKKFHDLVDEWNAGTHPETGTWDQKKEAAHEAKMAKIVDQLEKQGIDTETLGMDIDSHGTYREQGLEKPEFAPRHEDASGDTMDSGGSDMGQRLTPRQAVQAFKDAVFGESDEPNWDRAAAVLAHVPNSEGVLKKLGEVKTHYAAPPAPDFDISNPKDPWNVKNLQLITELENLVDQVTPGKRIPNPNE